MDLKTSSFIQFTIKTCQNITGKWVKCIKNISACRHFFVYINKWVGKHVSRRGNSILIVLIIYIYIYINLVIVDSKLKVLVYYGNTVIFLLPSRECMRENNYIWLISPSMTLCSIRSDFLLEIIFFSRLYNYHIKCRSLL